MTLPRKQQICIDDTPYYHIVSRCVRRTFLCGVDHHTGKSYEHRRSWIENRIRILSSIFGVEICAYCVMSNHIHIVVKLCPDEIESLSNEEIIERWSCLFKGPVLVQKWQQGDSLHPEEARAVDDCVAAYRKRLASLSWFMKCLNEPIARQANKEDKCTGHFWESRYKSQALLTQEALLSCLVYVDLNPVRACIATTPEHSEYTSIKERIKPQFVLSAAVKEQIKLQAILKFDLPIKPLAPFEGTELNDKQEGILYSQSDYLNLVDFTGRAIRDDKRSAISNQLPPILVRLGLDHASWLENATRFERDYNYKFSRRQKRRSKAA